MMNLAEYRKKNVGLADFLPWAALVAPGVVSIRTARFSGRRGFAGPTSTAPRRLSWWQPSGCRRPKKDRAWRGGSTKAASAPASIHGNC